MKLSPDEFQPAQPLKRNPTVKSLDDADAALDELSRIAAHRRIVSEMASSRAAEIKKEFSAQLAREGVPYDQREKLLRDSLAKFFTEQRDDLFVAKKSISLAHGTCGFRSHASQSRVSQDAGSEIKTPSDLAPELADAATRAAKRCKLASGLSGDRFLRVSIEFDYDLILAGYRAGTITDDDLSEMGLVYIPPETRETFFATPAPFKIHHAA